MLWLLGCGAKAPPRPRPEAEARPARKTLARATTKQTAPSVSGYGRERALALSWRFARGADGTPPRFEVQRRPLDRKKPFATVQTVDLAAPAGARIGRDSVEILDFDLAPGEQYEYRVRALDSRGKLGPPSRPTRVEWREPPAPPRALTARPGDRVVELGWEASSDAGVEGYNVYRAAANEEPAPAPLNSRPVDGTTFVDLGPANNQEFRYTVRSLVRAGDLQLEGPPCLAASVIPRDLEPPPPPAGLKARIEGKQIRISWNAVVVDDLQGYRVYRRGAGVSDYSLLTEKPIRATRYTDRKADPTKPWSYVITAVDTAPSRNESGHSREVTVGATNGL